jgi:hypothetical protein
MAAVKKSRDLLIEKFGRNPPTPAHFCKPLTKTLLQTCADTFPKEFEFNSKSKFREHGTICITWLWECYDMLSRKATAIYPDGGFVSVTDNPQANHAKTMTALYNPPHKFLCFNDDCMMGEAIGIVTKLMNAFLPDKSSYELTE